MRVSAVGYRPVRTKVGGYPSGDFLISLGGCGEGKWYIESRYPTQAKRRLEWGTQSLSLDFSASCKVVPLIQNMSSPQPVEPCSSYGSFRKFSPRLGGAGDLDRMSTACCYRGMGGEAIPAGFRIRSFPGRRSCGASCRRPSRHPAIRSEGRSCWSKRQSRFACLACREYPLDWWAERSWGG